MVPEDHLAELVHYLLEVFLSDANTKQISLHMASIKGQLVIRAGCICEKHRQPGKTDKDRSGKAYGQNRISNRKIRKYMKGHPTTISRKKEGFQTEVTIIIE